MIYAMSYSYGENSFRISKKPEISFRTSITAPIQQSMKNRFPSVSSAIFFDFNSLYGELGFNICIDSSDTVLNLFLKPLAFDRFELGVGLGYHIYDYFSSFLEHDFLFNNYIACLYSDILRVQINFGLFEKVTKFKNLNKARLLCYTTFIFGVNINWNISKYIKLYSGVNSIDYYDYSLFGTPYFSSGIQLSLKDNFNVGIEYKMKLIDMVAVAENISEMLLTFYMKVRL